MVRKITKGGVYVSTDRVYIKWCENGVKKKKEICITRNRSKEEAEKQAREFYEKEVLSKYEEDNKNTDYKQLAKQKKSEWRKQKIKEKYTCVCGKTIGIYGKYTHEKTEFHRDFFAERDEIMIGGHKVERICRRNDDIEKYYNN